MTDGSWVVEAGAGSVARSCGVMRELCWCSIAGGTGLVKGADGDACSRTVSRFGSCLAGAGGVGACSVMGGGGATGTTGVRAGNATMGAGGCVAGVAGGDAFEDVVGAEAEVVVEERAATREGSTIATFHLNGSG